MLLFFKLWRSYLTFQGFLQAQSVTICGKIFCENAKRNTKKKKKNLKYKITFLTHSIKISGGKKKTIKAAGSYNEIFNKCIHSFNIY